MAARKPVKRPVKKTPVKKVLVKKAPEKFVYSYEMQNELARAKEKPLQKNRKDIPAPPEHLEKKEAKKRPLWIRLIPYVIIIILALASYYVWTLPAFDWNKTSNASRVNTTDNTNVIDIMISPEIGQVNKTNLDIINKSIEIDSLAQGSVIIRNVGSAAIDVSEIHVYLGNVSIKCRSWSTPLPIGSIRSCNFPSPCMPGQQITVASPGNMAFGICP
jgi:hypothetical protein